MAIGLMKVRRLRLQRGCRQLFDPHIYRPSANPSNELYYLNVVVHIVVSSAYSYSTYFSMSDELNKGELCRGCQHISVDGLVSDDGISHILLPGRCQFCKLLFQTLKSCGCKSEWEVEGDGCEQKVWRAEMQDENLTLGPRWTNPNWRKALWDGPKPEGHVRLWARPIEQARQLFDELQGKPDSERGSRLELRLEGVTVCYGRPRVMDNMSWPASLHGIEHGSNALQEAISPLHGDGVYMKHLEHNKTHVCAGSLVFTASPSKLPFALYTSEIHV